MHSVPLSRSSLRRPRAIAEPLQSGPATPPSKARGTAQAALPPCSNAARPFTPSPGRVDPGNRRLIDVSGFWRQQSSAEGAAAAAGGGGEGWISPASTRGRSSSVCRYELVGTIQRISYTRRRNDASLVVFPIPASGSDAVILFTARVGASKRRGLRPGICVADASGHPCPDVRHGWRAVRSAAPTSGVGNTPTPTRILGPTQSQGVVCSS